MTIVRDHKPSTNRGEIDPILDRRSDLDAYSQAVKTMRDVFPLPEGGYTRAWGLEWTAALPSPTNNYQIIPFKLDEDNSYTMVAFAATVQVFKAGVLQASITIPHTNAQISDLNWAQSLNTLILFHDDVQTRRIVRGGDDTTWTIDNVPFLNIPTHEFNDATSGVGTAAARKGTSIAFASDQNDFVAGDVGNFIAGAFGGYAEIVGFTDAKNVTIDIVQSFPIPEDGVATDPPDDMPAGEWSIEDQIWSTARGWPNCGTFFQGRLFMGGGKSRPGTLLGSVAFSFYDFNRGKARAGDGIEATIDADQVPKIQQIQGSTKLKLLTTEGTYFLPQDAKTPITPTNIAIDRATKRKSLNVRPVEVDALTMFIDKTGHALREMQFFVEDQNFRTVATSVFSSHFFETPIGMAVRSADSTEEGDWLFLVNDPDLTGPFAGELILVSMFREQNVAGFALRPTSGSFRAVGVDNNEDVYVVVTRQKDAGAPVLATLERMNKLHLLDLSTRITTGLPTDTFSGLGHLEGRTVKVISDGKLLADVVVAGGSVTISEDATESVEIGIDLPDVRVEYLPPVINLENGTAASLKKRIPKVTLDLSNTTGIRVQDKAVPLQKFGELVFDEAPIPFTGEKHVAGIRGWAENPIIKISQIEPANMTVKAITMKVQL